MGVELSMRQRVDARALGGLCCALCAFIVELGLARLLLRQACCCALLLSHGHFEALPRPLAQQLTLLLAPFARSRTQAAMPSASQG
eukprot:4393287-Pleurochrysis_carterae.AAC.2